MQHIQLDNLNRILCLGCHPDDIEIGCGGTLAQLIAACPSLHVDWIVLSGNQQRRAEAQRSAARWLAGAASQRVEVFEFRDSYFPAQYAELKTAMHELAAGVQPDLIFTHRIEDRHQDHRLVAELTWNAFRDRWIFEYEIPKYEGDLGHPNMFVPIESEVCRWKIDQLMEQFASQAEKPWFNAPMFEAQMRMRAIECGGGCEFAEAFHVRKSMIRFA